MQISTLDAGVDAYLLHPSLRLLTAAWCGLASRLRISHALNAMGANDPIEQLHALQGPLTPKSRLIGPS